MKRPTQILSSSLIISFFSLLIISCQKTGAKKESIIQDQPTLTFSVGDTVYEITGSLADSATFGCELRKRLSSDGIVGHPIDTSYNLSGIYNTNTSIIIMIKKSSIEEDEYSHTNDVSSSESDCEAHINGRDYTTSYIDLIGGPAPSGTSSSVTLTNIHDGLADGVFTATIKGDNDSFVDINNGEFRNVQIVN